jgi:hypothetical protein
MMKMMFGVAADWTERQQARSKSAERRVRGRFIPGFWQLRPSRALKFQFRSVI